MNNTHVGFLFVQQQSVSQIHQGIKDTLFICFISNQTYLNHGHSQQQLQLQPPLR
jgi:hypothetical protein